jgi:aminopeptidase-like protein
VSVDQYELIADLHPLRRDLISDGFDEALERLCGRFSLQVHRFPSGAPCWTWRIPDKWTCDEAFVETPGGARVIDQARHPLHVASYSCPIDQWVTREELLAHLHVHPRLPEQPPFIFHYYTRTWGFC